MKTMTILEAHVPPDKWEALQTAYEGLLTMTLPSQLEQTFLLQSESEPTIWRATSIWRSRAELEEYRNSVETPGGVLLFRSVDVEPTLTIFNITTQAANGT